MALWGEEGQCGLEGSTSLLALTYWRKLVRSAFARLSYPADWRAYWQALGQPWRTEPEIDEERKEELARRRAIAPDSDQAEYPFRDVALSRRDVEWLLATHDDGRGPVHISWGATLGIEFGIEEPYRRGLDLRGAILRTDLSHLPLGATRLEGAHLEEAHLEGADLQKAHLEGANLEKAHLEGVQLREAHLEGADLRGAHLKGGSIPGTHLEGASLWYAHLEGANLPDAHLEGASLPGAYLEGAILWYAHLEGADLREAHLQNADLRWASLGSKNMKKDADALERIRDWQVNFPEMLSPADLRGAFLDMATDLREINLIGAEHVSPKLADLHWNDTNLAVVSWEEVDELGDEHYAKDLEDYKEAVRANRQLAVALREQGINEEADRFFYNAQELQRKVFRLQRQYKQHIFSLFSWLLAGYGYRPGWTLGWYLGVISVCSLSYWLLGMDYSDAIVGSVTAFHGRGLFDPQLTGWEGGVAAVEAFLGLVIEVAFIVTFTQRFFSQ